MNAFIKNLVEEIDQNTRAFQHEFGDLDGSMLNAKPSPDTWSIAQNIHHLIVINQSYIPVIKKAHKGQIKVPFWGKWPIVHNFLGSMILKSSGPDRNKKITTFPIWQPNENPIDAEIVQKFAYHQEELKSMVKNAAPLMEKNALITSPANSSITYTLSKAFEIIVAHEKRHLSQALEVKANLAVGSW